jgi:glycosyltransferase involved in cell wall biosynthesis
MSTKTEGGRRLQASIDTEPPLISIISVAYQAGHELPALLDSILRLKDPSVELIVIDGGSTDGTVELLRTHDAEIDYWLSEPDRGIYDAMNKAIAAARGTFLLHLNAGDRLLSLPLKELEAAKAEDLDVAAFRVSVDGAYYFYPSSGAGLRFYNTLHHQGTFFRRETFPHYDTGYKIFADFDANQRMALAGARMKVFDEVVALHTSGGLSDIDSRPTTAEFFQVIAKNHGRSAVVIAWLLCKWRGLRLRVKPSRKAGREGMRDASAEGESRLK